MPSELGKLNFQILLAEDDEVSQDIVCSFLKGSNLELTITSDGRKALEIALQRQFDLMIFDQNMPFITGDRVIRHLRAGRTLNADTPVIRFTASADVPPPDPTSLVGRKDVLLPKPIKRESFIATIQALLGNK